MIASCCPRNEANPNTSRRTRPGSDGGLGAWGEFIMGGCSRRRRSARRHGVAPRLTYRAKVDHIGGGDLLDSSNPEPQSKTDRSTELGGIRRFEARRPDAFVGVVSPEQDRRARRKVPSQWAAGGLYMAAVVNRMIVVDDRDPEGKKPASCRRESEARTLTSDFPGARYFADELNCSSAGRSPENRNRAIGEAWVPQSITAGARASSANRALQIADDWQPLAGQPSGGDDDQRPQ